MAGTKLSADEQAFFDTPPEDTPLDEVTADRTPAEEPPEETPADEKKGADPDKKPEAKADDKKEPVKAKDEKKASKPPVAWEALEEERHRRKAAVETLRQERAARAERDARLDERMAIINEALRPKEEEPDPDKDIFGAFEHLKGQFNELHQQRTTEQQQAAENRRQQEQVNHIRTAYEADAEMFAVETPDFRAAYDFLLASRQKELRLLPAYRNNPAALRQAIQADELAIVQSALESGDSPAAVIYAIAGARGYAPKQPEPPEEKPADEAKKSEEVVKQNGADKIDEIEKRRDASISLSDGGGSPGGEKITLEAIDRMKPDEFKAFVARINKNNPKGYDKLMARLMVG